MKKPNREFIDKIARMGGAYDTMKYRYIIDSDRNVKRTLLENLGTTAMLAEDAWEIVGEY